MENIEELNENMDIIKCKKCNKPNEKKNYLVICKLCKCCRDKNKIYKDRHVKKKNGEEIPPKEKKKTVKKEDNFIKVDIKKLMELLENYEVKEKDKFLNELLIN